MTPPPRQRHFDKALAIGFGTSVAMWAIAYFAMMKPGLVIGEILFALMIACLIAGGFIAGRRASANENFITTGLLIGFVSATVNLLVVGTMIANKTSTQTVMWIGAMYVVSIIVATIGVAVGGVKRASDRQPNWFHVFTCVAAATVFLLLTSGGLVTGLEVGLAVPDWPNTFGHNMLLYPLSEMTGGVYYEHAHRLYGTLVGVTAITLAIGVFLFDSRAWLRTLGIVYLVIVCVQGVLGGTRVTETSIALAITHGIFGQIVFAVIISIAAFTSPTWISDREPSAHSKARSYRIGSLHLLVMLLLQLVLGASYRHLNEQPDIPIGMMHGILGLHVLVALAILIAGIIIGGKLWSTFRDVPALSRLGAALLILVALQVVLGVIALIAVLKAAKIDETSLFEVITTTIHQANGALLLAVSTLLVLWTRRLLVIPSA